MLRNFDDIFGRVGCDSVLMAIFEADLG